MPMTSGSRRIARLGALQDDRARLFLRHIVELRLDDSFATTTLASEERYRQAAALALRAFVPSDAELGDVLTAYDNERQAARAVQRVVAGDTRAAMVAGGNRVEPTPGYRESLTTEEGAFVFVLVPTARDASGMRAFCADSTWCDLPHAPGQAAPCVRYSMPRHGRARRRRPGAALRFHATASRVSGRRGVDASGIGHAMSATHLRASVTAATAALWLVVPLLFGLAAGAGALVVMLRLFAFTMAFGGSTVSRQQEVLAWIACEACALIAAFVSSLAVESLTLRAPARADRPVRRLLWSVRVVVGSLLLSLPWVVPRILAPRHRNLDHIVATARTAGVGQEPAIWELARIGSDGACQALAALADDGKQAAMPRATAVAAAAAACPAGPQIALRFAGDREPLLRAAAGATLRYTAFTPGAREALASLRRDPDAYVREAAAAGWNPSRLAQIREMEARTPYERLLRDGSPRDVLRAAVVLHTGREETLRILMDTSQPDDLRVEAIEVLGTIGSSPAAPLLRDIVTSVLRQASFLRPPSSGIVTRRATRSMSSPMAGRC